MTTLNFPRTPTVGEIFTFGAFRYRWDSEKWTSVGLPTPETILREVTKRSYAEAGFNLVAGSFERGGVLVNSNDVLIAESSGKCYTGPQGIVPAGTDPLSPGFGDRSASILRGNGVFGAIKFTGSSGGGVLLVSDQPNSSTNVQQEPSGRLQAGETCRRSWFFDPYQSDTANYRSFNIFTEVTGSRLHGENGRAVIDLTSAGNQTGVWPALHVGFEGGSKVPLKLFYFDTSDVEWRQPMRGSWVTSTPYAVGDYTLNQNKLFKAATSGVSGVIAPIHSAGVVSDGSVQWEFIRDYQSSINSMSACALFGHESDMPLFGHGDTPVQRHCDSLTKNGFIEKWLLQNGQVLARSGVKLGSDCYEVEMSGGGSTKIYDGWKVSVSLATCMSPSSVSNNSTAVDISTKEMVSLNNTSPTVISTFTGGRANQVFFIESTNNNSSLAHNSQIRLKGGVNLPLTTDTIIHFVRHSDGRYIQI